MYQFDNAARRATGSRSPSTRFALAAGNTNPPVIDDPPVPMRHVSRPTAFFGTFHSSAHLAASYRQTLPTLMVSKLAGLIPWRKVSHHV